MGTTATRVLESLPYLWKNLDSNNKKSFDANICNYWDNLIKTEENQDWIKNISIYNDSITFETSIYITPGFIFKIIDELITNFHLG